MIMLGGFRIIVGFIICVLIFVLVFAVMFCGSGDEQMFCKTFEPAVSFIQSLIGSR